MDTPAIPAKAQAEMDMRDIATLEKTDAFSRYFLREPEREIRRLEGELTTKGHMAEGDRREKAGELSVWRRVRDKLEADKRGNRTVLGLAEDEQSER